MARRSFELNGSKAEDFGLETEPTSANRRHQMKLQLSLAASWGFIQIERPVTLKSTNRDGKLIVGEMVDPGADHGIIGIPKAQLNSLGISIAKRSEL